VRAFRSVSGRVLRYDPKAAQYVPVSGASVALRELGLSVTTDILGRYLFRDLAAGSYTLMVQNEVRTVRLRDQPVDLANVDFRTGVPDGAPLPPQVATVATAASPVKTLESSSASDALDARVATGLDNTKSGRHAQPFLEPTEPVRLAPQPLDARAAAERHNILGRQLTKVGRYREAIVELTAAVHLAPRFALAFNARGFVLILLRDWAGAIKDLNEAIAIDPMYSNAYQLRAIARNAIGDAPGAAADLKRWRQLTH